eukprot:1727271-Amphidinium_carterae.1
MSKLYSAPPVTVTACIFDQHVRNHFGSRVGNQASGASNPRKVASRGVHTVWTDGSGRHSSNPHFGVALAATRTLVKVSGCLLKVSERLNNPNDAIRLVSDCKGVVACLHALRAGRTGTLKEGPWAPGCVSGWGCNQQRYLCSCAL